MLVLGRKASERILIGQEIRVTVIALETGNVRIGIEAPREVRVLRGEATPAPNDRDADLRTSLSSGPPGA